MTKRSTRRAAVGHVAHLTRPEGIGQAQWRNVRNYLFVIAGYYPKPYPSQARLAEDLGCSLRSIREYQRLCQDHGLLHVTADAGAKGKRNNWSKTNRYHIIVGAESASTDEAESAPKVPSARYACLQHDASHLHSPSEEAQPCQPPAGRSNVLPMLPRSERESQAPSKHKAPKERATASDHLSAGHARKGVSKKGPRRKEPWQLMADYFSLQWYDLISQPENKDLRDIRDVENAAQCKAYFNARLTNYTTAETRAYIDEFMRLVTQRHIRIKNGKSAWLTFTMSWGRPRGMDDPGIASKVNSEYVPPQRRAK